MAVTIPPWLRPADVLGAIHTGAQIGLHLAAQQQAAQEAEANRQERAQRASEALQMHGLETALRLMEMRARNAELAGYHKESVDARKAADVLRGEYQKGELALREKELSNRDLHNLMMEDIQSSKANRQYEPVIRNYNGKDFLVNPNTGHAQSLEQSAGAGRELSGLTSAITQIQKMLSPENSVFLDRGQKEALRQDLAAARTRQMQLLNLPQAEPKVPIVTPEIPQQGHNWLGFEWGGYKPEVPATTNWVPASAAAALTNTPALRIPESLMPPPDSASSALTNATPRPNLATPKLAPAGVRVRQKSTGRLGTWTDEGPPPSDFEIIEEGKIDEGPNDFESVDEEVEQE